MSPTLVAIVVFVLVGAAHLLVPRLHTNRSRARRRARW